MADSSSMNYVYTIGGYAALVAAGYVIYQVSTQKGRKRASQAKSVKPSQAEPRKEDRKKKQRLESFASDGAESSSRPQKAKARATPAEPSTWASGVQTFDTSDDGVDNREFAKQFAKAREGAKLAQKTESGKQREKSVKQSRASQMEGIADIQMSPPSSTTGADADDDQSPVTSPVAAPADSSGVADMLEPAPKGPSILRLTDTGSSQTQKPKVAKAPQPVETKKQRQNKKKAEAAKAAREEAETERKALEEKQRRAARIAEGRAAKDGSQFMAVNGGGKSAWSQGAPNGKPAQTTEAGTLYQPLDTFEATPAATTNKQSTKPPTEGAWMSSLPSEEEQLEMLKEEADEWSTVKTKSSKKLSKTGSSLESGDEPAAVRPAAQPKQAGPSSTKPGQAASAKTFGSFSALSTKDEPADDAEEEWDV